MSLRARSLFSGIGGFDAGFERAGIPTVSQCEFDANARSVLERHYPHVERTIDVRETSYGPLGPDDVVCGGFPCQDVSLFGNRAGLDGKRSGLWFELYRILEESKPGWVVIENVPGLLSSNSGRDFGVILRGLVGLGYGVCWRILNAQYFGLAQRRRRVFIIGHIGDGRAAKVLFEPLVSVDAQGYSEGIHAQRQSGRSRIGVDSQGNDSGTMQLSGRERYLMPVECERLQGFPDGWTDGQEDRVRYKQLGNAVAVPVIQWIAERIKRVHESGQA